MFSNSFSDNDLLSATQNNEFLLYYQPIVDSVSDIIWVEALMRWNNPSIGMVSPEVFIPLMEKNKLIIKAGSWVLKEACTQLKKWKKHSNVNYGISVNVSSLQLQQYNFKEIVYNTLIQTELKPEYLLLEITESIDLGVKPHIVNTLKDLRELGVRISIDDFGTGYNSLKYLQELEFTSLKIDKSFVANLDTNKGRVLTESVITLGHNLGVEIIAEGVENLYQYNILKGMKCDMFQGYYFYKPLPAEKFSNTKVANKNIHEIINYHKVNK